MDLTAWTLYLFIATLVISAAFLHYGRREPKGRGRWLLALLRGLALAVIVLLLFDPVVPTGRSGPPAVMALVDASLSMGLPDPSGGTPWAGAESAVAELRPERVAVFGADGARPVATLDSVRPTATGSRLGPALRAAIESGAERVVVLTDGAVEDPAEARRILDATAGVAVRTLGGERAFNAGIVDVSAPAVVRAGEEGRVTATVGRVGVEGPDTVELALRRGEQELARRRVPTPAAGRTVSAELTFTLREPSAEPVRVDLVLVGGGSSRDDDRRSAYLRVSDDPVGVVVVSFLPGQEPRFLMPVAARASGLSVRGWAAVTTDRWVRLGAGQDAGRVEATEAPRRALERADVVVLHGLGESAPEWAVAAMESADRVLVFPADGADALPLEPGPARVAEWYVSEAVPPSPVAPLLAGVETDGVPPLTALRTPSAEGYWAPVQARSGRRGPPRPVLLARSDGGRRVAVALGEGYWRWALAGGAGRTLYDRMWSAVFGWLGEAGPPADPDGIEPVDRVVARGEALRWRVPGEVDSVRIRLRPVDGGRGGTEDTRAGAGPDAGQVVDRTVVVRGGVAVLPAVRPGHYRYTVDGGGAAQGELTVSSHSPELTRPVVLGSAGGRPGEAREADGAVERPLRSTPWGYLAVIVLLSAEWVLRRRWGLR